MQEYSRTRTFLIQRSINRAEPQEKKRLLAGLEYVMLPAVAYKVSITSHPLTENVIVRTVVDLANIYEREGTEWGSVLDRVAGRTKLNRLLVKAILKRYKNTLDEETGEENPDLVQKFYYLLYDPISEKAFPDLVPVEQFEESSRFEYTSPGVVDFRRNTGRFVFQLSMGDSRRISAGIPCCSFDSGRIPKEPPVSRRIERRYLRDHRSRLSYLGISETVGLICPCFLSREDLSKLHMMNPVGHGMMDQLYENIRKILAEQPDSNESLAQRMEKLEAERREILAGVETFTDSKGEMKKKVRAAYPDINMYPDLLEHMTVLEMRCAEYSGALEKVGGSGADTGKIGGELVIAFHSALEELFALSLEKNFPRNRTREIDEVMEPLGQGRDYSAYFAGLAERLGQEGGEACRQFFMSGSGRIRIRVLQNAMANSLLGRGFKKALPELVAAHIIQAAVEETHPFRAALERCPDLLRVVQTSLELRNTFKHGGDGGDRMVPPDQREAADMQILAETMLDILLVRKASAEELAQNERDLNARQAALIKAGEQMKAFPVLGEIVPKAAKEACYRFFYQDPEYFSACSNLLSELLDQLFSEYTVKGQRQAAAERFTGDPAQDDAAVHALFRKYGCDYVSEDRPNTAKIKTLIHDPQRLPLKCKLYLAFMTLDETRPELLKKLLHKSPDILILIDTVCIRREHSKLADFSNSPDHYLEFHKTLAANCETFCETLKGGA